MDVWEITAHSALPRSLVWLRHRTWAMSGATIKHEPTWMTPEQHVLLRSQDLSLLLVENHDHRGIVWRNKWVWQSLLFLDKKRRSPCWVDSGQGAVHKARGLESDGLLTQSWLLPISCITVCSASTLQSFTVLIWKRATVAPVSQSFCESSMTQCYDVLNYNQSMQRSQ